MRRSHTEPPTLRGRLGRQVPQKDTKKEPPAHHGSSGKTGSAARFSSPPEGPHLTPGEELCGSPAGYLPDFLNYTSQED